MHKLLKITVIIPAYNSQETISSCLKALEIQTIEREMYEIIVVDDGSIDNTSEIIETYPDVRLIVIPHGGPSIARNTGAKAALGELIAFTDADCEPVPEWLEEITSPFTDKKIVGVKGAYRTKQKKLVSRFVQLEYQSKYKRMAHMRYIDFIDTYSAAYRRDVFLANGGFDTSFTVPSVEDQELSFRLAQKGYLLVFSPKAVVFHRHDRTVREYWKRKFGIGYWKAFLLRWLPQKTFSDSHTPLSQHLQIAFLGIALLSLVISFFLGWFIWVAVGLLGLFFAVGFSFWLDVIREDPLIGLIYPGLILLRATALGMGLTVGFLAPPQKGQHIKPSLSFVKYLSKRIFDFIGATIGLILSSPVILFSIIAIKIDSPGPAFFTQIRAGENGKPFRMVKLRTMVDGAEEKLAEVIKFNTLEGPVYKIPNDPRITRLGRWLRRWSVDELPQFWNVLRGEMSLVGPRPEEIWVVERYNDQQRQRLAIKPGLTGPMQINGRGDLNFDERLRLEIEYMQDYSLIKDFHICLKSLSAMINGKGAY
jgi:lipopolysaccharide/colanic/teichoic acid biosynthesis glycosyltransferase/glycosyltransferase involved in cell wall biosynthesis